MFDILTKYKNNGYFDFEPDDKLVSVCNAPTNKSGVYLVWNSTCNGNKELIYIGRSGKKENGKIVHRKAGLGGIKDRLVNGHQFGKFPRKRIWPIIMLQYGIKKLTVSWFDTENDDPVEVERLLLNEILHISGSLPVWNNQPY